MTILHREFCALTTPPHEGECDCGEAIIAALRDEVARGREALSGIAELDCEYGDGCPTFGTRRCIGCEARRVLEETNEED